MEKRLFADELYQYLTLLHDILQNRNANELAEIIKYATHFTIGSPTEFYAESRIALQRVIDDAGHVLSKTETKDLSEKIESINYEFKIIGGA